MNKKVAPFLLAGLITTSLAANADLGLVENGLKITAKYEIGDKTFNSIRAGAGSSIGGDGGGNTPGNPDPPAEDPLLLTPIEIENAYMDLTLNLSTKVFTRGEFNFTHSLENFNSLVESGDVYLTGPSNIYFIAGDSEEEAILYLLKKDFHASIFDEYESYGALVDLSEDPRFANVDIPNQFKLVGGDFWLDYIDPEDFATQPILNLVNQARPAAGLNSSTSIKWHKDWESFTNKEEDETQFSDPSYLFTIRDVPFIVNSVNKERTQEFTMDIRVVGHEG